MVSIGALDNSTPSHVISQIRLSVHDDVRENKGRDMKGYVMNTKCNSESSLSVVSRLERKLEDRIEHYDNETNGVYSNCGKPIIRVNGSNSTANTDKTRYRYPEDITTAWNIFRCKFCKSVISDNFEAD